MPMLDATITISIILAICALFAPSITAIINNRHQYRLRKLELSHDELFHRSDLMYRNKYDIYKEFLRTAGEYGVFNGYDKDYVGILSSLQMALLVCDAETQALLLSLQATISDENAYDEKIYTELLTKIAKSFNRELSLLSTKNNN